MDTTSISTEIKRLDEIPFFAGKQNVLNKMLQRGENIGESFSTGEAESPVDKVDLSTAQAGPAASDEESGYIMDSLEISPGLLEPLGSGKIQDTTSPLSGGAQSGFDNKTSPQGDAQSPGVSGFSSPPQGAQYSASQYNTQNPYPNGPHDTVVVTGYIEDKQKSGPAGGGPGGQDLFVLVEDTSGSSPEQGGGGGGFEISPESKKIFQQDIDNLFTGFKQGAQSNCASIANIKAAMDVYGDKIFDKIELNQEGGMDITMKDKFKVSINSAEFAMSQDAAHFQGPDGYSKFHANIVFAAMAKRAQMTGRIDEKTGKPDTTFSKALNDLNNGAYTDTIPELMGLKDNVVPVSLDELQNGNIPYDGLVLRGETMIDGSPAGHAVYGNNVNGSIMADFYGTSIPYQSTLNTSFYTHPFTFKSAYYFKP